MQQAKISVQDICCIALMAAVTVVMAQISIPMPMGVPMTMQTFAVTLAGVILGSKRGGLSILVYILLGAIGLPVFAGFSGGIQNLVGPTGGFLISFPIMAWLIGVGVEKRKQTGMFILFLILGTVANYVIGVVMFCAIMHASVTTAVAACVIPFIPTAIIKAVVAAILGLKIRDRLAVSMQWA
ncbi:biotin transporter BioY [Mediterraneibacter butyricigenes]|uniref:Biotin transporter n=1 Tax=Mediterraneibacter butyricigenes TaxID=2316025 RepID=A0A391P9K9_9FIRM|nr:biotin transporter BioY [Mediterraneibacter butyricigenes]GCA66273.1 biotin transporter BioY [Mediterraneibacter butyricigenes]